MYSLWQLVYINIYYSLGDTLYVVVTLLSIDTKLIDSGSDAKKKLYGAINMIRQSDKF